MQKKQLFCSSQKKKMHLKHNTTTRIKPKKNTLQITFFKEKYTRGKYIIYDGGTESDDYMCKIQEGNVTINKKLQKQI